ncbi:type VII secretion protein EccE [Mycobacterium sp. Aquia_216]|uniref:type VII secretion protein EccE n=1 Tax=Mycobacterium sp. Aquia_216 TaxID=2991729 RepID=UPI00227AAA6F|nr:type VII secretion protein EccE [Mycobacterium sp. Aquia_216]WAJ46379.1 type VII secretion protein EccE [Mycobacterium sp. Aquia_216]
MTTRSATRPVRAQPEALSRLVATTAITPQRILPISNLLAGQFFVAAGVAGEELLHRPGWYGAAVGLVIAVAMLVPVRGGSLPHHVVERLGFWYDRRRRGRRPHSFETFDAELSEGAQIGFHWDGKVLVSLMRIEQNPQALTIMEPAMTVSGEMISLRMLAECLQQFDISLESIDVVSRGVRVRSRDHIGAVYDAVLGPLPAIAARTVYVAVRMDPTRCPAAVRHRGGGWEGIVRTAATATRRVGNRLVDAGLRPHIVTAAEIAAVTEELSGGMELHDLDETWQACRNGRLELRTFFLKPSMFTASGLGLLWTVPTQSTTICVTLRREERDDLIKLRGLVRFDTYGRTRVDLPGLGQLPGRQYAALVCALPVPSPRRALRHWVFGKGLESVGELALPASGCGQLVGADERGRAVAVPLFGPRVQRVEMCGTLHLAQQVVLRSLALGARVRVHTGRSAAWRAMAEQVGDHELLNINGHNAEAAPTGRASEYSVEMFDGVAERIVRDAVTTMVVKPSHAPLAENADVTLQLLDHDRDLVRVGTRSESAIVTMVATDDEMHYIKSSLDIAD